MSKKLFRVKRKNVPSWDNPPKRRYVVAPTMINLDFYGHEARTILIPADGELHDLCTRTGNTTSIRLRIENDGPRMQYMFDVEPGFSRTPDGIQVVAGDMVTVDAPGQGEANVFLSCLYTPVKPRVLEGTTNVNKPEKPKDEPDPEN